VRSAKHPEKNTRDLFIGYLLVFVSYSICGALGYFGFLGTKFTPYFVNVTKKCNAGACPSGTSLGLIDQNCLNMFAYTDVAAFILRLAIFFLLFSTYPLVNFFLKNILLNLFYRNKPTTKLIDLVMNLSMTLIPLLFALFYPNIGTILSYASAVSGLLIIYVFPVMVHLKQMKSRIMHPLLAEALETNEYKVVID